MSENRRRRNNGAQNRQVKKARTNNARRILLLVGLMSLVAVISIGGTIAWLTDTTGPVTNTFTAANIDIDLTETKAPNGGNLGTNEKWEAKLIPGSIYAKNPKVTVAAESEACWLFVHVDAKNNKISFTNENGQEVELDNVIGYSVPSDWKPVMWTDTIEGTVTKAGFYYMTIDATTAKTGASYDVLTGGTDKNTDGQVTINEDLTKEMEDYIEKNADKKPKIVITAAAVQSENVGTLAQAWAKLPKDFTK